MAFSAFAVGIPSTLHKIYKVWCGGDDDDESDGSASDEDSGSEKSSSNIQDHTPGQKGSDEEEASVEVGNVGTTKSVDKAIVTADDNNIGNSNYEDHSSDECRTPERFESML